LQKKSKQQTKERATAPITQIHMNTEHQITAHQITAHQQATKTLAMITENQRRIRSLKRDYNSILNMTGFARDILKSIADKEAVSVRLYRRYAAQLSQLKTDFLFT